MQNLPVPAFWALFEQIPRLRAEDDLYFMNAVSGSVWGGDYAENLQNILSDSDDGSEDFDKRALDKFKAMLK